MTTDQVKALIQTGLPNADVQVEDIRGTGDHFKATVVSREFDGLSLLEQHKKVYAAVGEHMIKDIHALQIDTAVPESPDHT